MNNGSLTGEQQRIQDKIFRKNVGFGGFSEIHGIHALSNTDVVALSEDMRNHVSNTVNLSDEFELLNKFRLYILNLDGYGFQGEFGTIQSYREGFSDMPVEELLDIFSQSDKENWEQDREYYYALFEIIEDKLKERGFDLAFDGLFVTGI